MSNIQLELTREEAFALYRALNSALVPLRASEAEQLRFHGAPKADDAEPVKKSKPAKKGSFGGKPKKGSFGGKPKPAKTAKTPMGTGKPPKASAETRPKPKGGWDSSELATMNRSALAAAYRGIGGDPKGLMMPELRTRILEEQ